jgi:ABC-2 type transport system ATP-binding protein
MVSNSDVTPQRRSAPHDGIVVESLTKRFDSFVAVDHIGLEVQAGEIFGFLGPNGAGKSTTVAMLTTLAQPSEGVAWVGGFDIAKQPGKVRQVAGVALQEIGLDPLLKAMELLTIHGRLFGLSRAAAKSRADELIQLVDLQDALDRPVGKYSGGMRRRLDLAMSLVHQPRILFLDEPTTGLDPASRRVIWDEIRRLNRDHGMTIFLTTQYLEEADSLAARVAIIDAGKIVVEGTPEMLKSELGGESINVSFHNDETTVQAEQALLAAAERLAIQKVQVDQWTLRLYLKNAASAVPAVVSHLETAGLRPQTLTVTKPTLDDVFLRYTGHRYEYEATNTNEATRNN